MPVTRPLTHRQSRFHLATSSTHREPDPYRALAAAIIYQAVADVHKAEAFNCTSAVQRDRLRERARADATQFITRSPWLLALCEAVGVDGDTLREQAMKPETAARLRKVATMRFGVSAD